MFVEERKQKILNILKQKEKISVNELSSIFSVSKVIIRKDLCQMEEEDILTRTHGGAILKKKIIDKNILKDIVKEELNEKIPLAEKVLSLIQEKDIIFLDNSVTNIILASFLQKKKIMLTVITNNLEIQKILSENKEIEIISLGGVYDLKSNSFIGDITKDNLKLFNPSKVFIEVGGINIEKMQMSVNTIDEGKLKKIALEVGKKCFILTSVKHFYQDSIFNFSKLENEISMLIDKNLPQEFENKLLENDIQSIKY